MATHGSNKNASLENDNHGTRTAPSTGSSSSTDTRTSGVQLMDDALSTSNDPRQQAAYDETLAEARAMDPEKVPQINLDVGEVVTDSLGVFEKMAPHRAYLAALHDFDIRNYDTLEKAALALSVAQGDYTIATTPPDSLSELGDRGNKLKRVFAAEAVALAETGIVDIAPFDAIHIDNSHRALGLGLMAYVRAYRASKWERVKTVSPLTDALLAEAEAISQRILAIVGGRAMNPARVAEAADIRARMFGICVGRYDQVRRAAVYMRWDRGDADELVPSLYAGKTRKPAAKNEPAKPAEPTLPADKSTTGTTAAPVTAPKAPEPAKSDEIPVGLPGGSPFRK